MSSAQQRTGSTYSYADSRRKTHKRGQKLSLFTLFITATAICRAGLCVQNHSTASLDASSCSTHINIK